MTNTPRNYLLLSPVSTVPGPVLPIRIDTSFSTVPEGQTLDLNYVMAGQAHAQVPWYKPGSSLPACYQVFIPRMWKSPWEVGYIYRGHIGSQVCGPCWALGSPHIWLSWLPRLEAPVCISPGLPSRCWRKSLLGRQWTGEMGRRHYSHMFSVWCVCISSNIQRAYLNSNQGH